jgi:hypothetical protein
MSPSYGALRQELKEKSGEKRLKRMTIDMGREGTVVEHENHAPHGKERFQFSPDEKSALAMHIGKHLGLKLPGKAAGESAEPAVSKENFE